MSEFKKLDETILREYKRFLDRHLEMFNQLKPCLPIKGTSAFSKFRDLIKRKNIVTRPGRPDLEFERRLRCFERTLFDVFQQFPEYQKDPNFAPVFAAMRQRGHDFEQNNHDHDSELENVQNSKLKAKIQHEQIILARLRPREKAVWLARQKWPYPDKFKEIAKRLGISESTARTYNLRAINKIGQTGKI